MGTGSKGAWLALPRNEQGGLDHSSRVSPLTRLEQGVEFFSLREDMGRKLRDPWSLQIEAEEQG